MKNHYRLQPKINAVTFGILLAYVGLNICCLRTSATPETLTTQADGTLLANRNLGSGVESRNARTFEPASWTTARASRHEDSGGNVPPLQNTLRVAVLPETAIRTLGVSPITERKCPPNSGEMRKSTRVTVQSESIWTFAALRSFPKQAA